MDEAKLEPLGIFAQHSVYHDPATKGGALEGGSGGGEAAQIFLRGEG